MPTCWNEQSLGDDNDHKNHMAYTTNGDVDGPCPSGFTKRVPQVQLFVRVKNYQGGTYQLSDGASVWHVDFFNGWKEGKLQELIDTCEPDRTWEAGSYNPPCSCDEKLTENTQATGALCDSEVRRLVIDEATDVTNQLPMGSCQGPDLIQKSWTEMTDGLLRCTLPPGISIDDEEEGASGDGNIASSDGETGNGNIASSDGEEGDEGSDGADGEGEDATSDIASTYSLTWVAFAFLVLKFIRR